MRPLRSGLMLAAAVPLVVALLPVGASASHEPDDQARILVFTKTAAFRHTAGINAARPAMQQLGVEHGFDVDLTEDSTAFTDENLAQYDAVMFLLTTGDVLDQPAQQEAFQRYIEGGGGFIGIHSASDTHHSWDWYGDLVGAYFVNHPPGQPNADIVVADDVHGSTAGLPTVWNRTDEWYNFDRNPRGDVHVLATIDETTYNPGSGAMGEDHPIAWCQAYEGGRSWYTAGGHGPQHYQEEAFLDHILGGIRWATGMEGGNCGGTVWDNFERTALDTDARFPQNLDIAPDGRVFYVELGDERRSPETSANVKVIDPDTATTAVVDTLDVYTGQPTGSNQEDGLVGIVLDPNFASNNWIYLYYAAPGNVPCPPTESDGVACGNVNLSRFILTDTGLEDERVLLSVTTQREECCHVGGSLAFDPVGDLYLTTGDDTNPFESQNYTPIDERDGRSPFDAQRSSANTNDLRGKVLRITPQPDGTYTIPEGNLFAPGTPSTRPEIYAMGFRNPFQADVDQDSGKLLVADYGPDANQPNAARGPEGRVEWNVVDEPGNYGWPYCHGTGVYIDFDFATGVSSDPFDCQNPVNDSPNNTGLTELPPVIDPEVWYGRGSANSHNGAIPPTGGAPMAGPVYQFDPDLDSDTKWPEYYDGQPFFYEWGLRTVYNFVLDDDWNVAKVNRTVPNLFPTGLPGNPRPMDMKFGPDGAMYVILWGHGFGTGGTSSVYRVDWVGGETCEASDVGYRTVAPGGVDSGVPNVVFGNGCSINQLIRDDLHWPTHGAFVEHVNDVTDELVAIGLISSADQESIISAAARSDIGRPGHPSRG